VCVCVCVCVVESGECFASAAEAGVVSRCAVVSQLRRFVCVRVVVSRMRASWGGDSVVPAASDSAIHVPEFGERPFKNASQGRLLLITPQLVSRTHTRFGGELNGPVHCEAFRRARANVAAAPLSASRVPALNNVGAMDNRRCSRSQNE
jgi:hypothetical protein